MKYTPLPSQEELLRLFTYSVITGELRWKVSPSQCVKAGDIAGTLHHKGYVNVSIAGTKYQAHRLIWRLLTGDDLTLMQIDHLNRDKSDNSWHNLRLATHSQNQCNTKPRSNQFGATGVCRTGRCTGYQARISYLGRKYSLGVFPTIEEAHNAYCRAAADLHGEFAQIQSTKLITNLSHG